MERTLTWFALAIGVLGWLYCRLVATADSAGKGPSFVSRPFLFTALALPALVLFGTLPDSPPFGKGEGFGHGFAIGAVGALLAAWVVCRPRETTSGHCEGAACVAFLTAPLFAALVAVAIPLLCMRLTIIDSLLGVAHGWLAVSLTLQCGVKRSSANVPALAALACGSGFAVTLCAVCALGVYRDFLTPDMVRGTWSAIAIALAAGVPFTMLVGAGLRGPSYAHPVRGGVIYVFLVSVLLLLLANMLSLRLLSLPVVSMTAAVGIAAGFLLWWTAVAERKREQSIDALPLGGLALLSAAVVAFALLQGFGLGIMLLAAWPFLGLALLRDDTGETGARLLTRMVPVFSFGVLLLLQRLFEQRFREDLHGVAITDYYALLGFLIGATLPSLLANLLQGPPAQSEEETRPSLARLFCVGAAVLLTPALLITLWNVKLSHALLFGLALSCLLQRGNMPAIALNASGIAVSIGLLLSQWTYHLLPLAEMSRAQRLRFLACIVLLLAAIIAGSDLSTRLRARRKRRAATA